MSVAVAVGFIALAGVAAETDIIMLTYLDNALKEVTDHCYAEGRSVMGRDLYAAIIAGAVERVRPKMTSVVAIIAGLLRSCGATDGLGSHAAHRSPDDRGMVSSTVLTLVLIPAVYT